MADLKTYPEGTPFTGRIGRTAATSEPAWPLPPQARDGAPNVLVFLLDDVGFAQLGCFGSDIDTPHIDALAADGVRFTNFHVTPMCSPTRAALLTGVNPHRAGAGHVGQAPAHQPLGRGDAVRRIVGLQRLGAVPDLAALILQIAHHRRQQHPALHHHPVLAVLGLERAVERAHHPAGHLRAPREAAVAAREEQLAAELLDKRKNAGDATAIRISIAMRPKDRTASGVMTRPRSWPPAS